MEKTEMMQLLSLYAERFGNAKMGRETMKMWWRTLQHEDYVQVAEVMDELVGGAKWAFGVTRVVDRLNDKFPKKRSSDEINSWEKEAPITSEESRRQISALMCGVIAENERCVRTNRPVKEWLSRVVKKNLETFGAKEVERICRANSNPVANKTQEAFNGLVNKALRA